MKKRSQIKLLALIAGSLIMVGPILALTSCSSAATPHGPTTNVNVSSIYTTLGGDYNQNDGTNHSIMLKYGDASSNDAISRVEIPNTPSNIPYSLSDANAKYTDKDASEESIKQAAFYYNEYYINGMLTQSLLSAAASLVNFAAHNLITDSIIDSGNHDSNWGDTNWTHTVYDSLVASNKTVKPKQKITEINKQMGQLREFMAAWVLGAGSGSNTYHIWPKNVSYTLSYRGYDSLGHKTENLHDQALGFDPKTNLDKLRNLNNNIIVSDISIDFAWYKTSKTGGSWVDSGSELSALQKQTHDAGTWSSLDYTIPGDIKNPTKDNPCAGTEIKINPDHLDYHINMGDMELTTAKTYYAKKDDPKKDDTTDVYSGLLEMTSPLVGDSGHYSVDSSKGSFLKFNAFDQGGTITLKPSFDVDAFDKTNKLINATTLTTDLKANDWDSIKDKILKYVAFTDTDTIDPKTNPDGLPGLYQILSFDKADNDEPK